MEAIGEHTRHRRGLSESSTSSRGLAYLSDSSQARRIRKSSLEDLDMNTSHWSLQRGPRDKARRPPTIDTHIARPDYATKTSLLSPLRSPYDEKSSTVIQRNIQVAIATSADMLSKEKTADAPVGNVQNALTPWEDYVPPRSAHAIEPPTTGILPIEAQNDRR
jgi:hypothetical protein